MKEKIQFTDRYQALGVPYPDPKTMCKGQCEGTGWVPHQKPTDKEGEVVMVRQEGDDVFDKLWDEAHTKPHKEECDGWHFLKCPECNGTGKATP